MVLLKKRLLAVKKNMIILEKQLIFIVNRSINLEQWRRFTGVSGNQNSAKRRMEN